MIKVKKLSERCLSFLLSILMIISISPIKAYSVDGSTVDNFEHNAGGGTSKEGEYTEDGWTEPEQGYRVSLLSGNQLFPLLGANAVRDIVYSQIPSNTNEQTKNRLGQERGKLVTDFIGVGGLSDIAGLPPSLLWDMSANGIAVREYLMGNSEVGGGGQGNPGGYDRPQINWGTKSTAGAGSATGKSGATQDEKYLL